MIDFQKRFIAIGTLICIFSLHIKSQEASNDLWTEHTIDTVIMFDPDTYEEQIKIIHNDIYKKADRDPILVTCLQAELGEIETACCHEQTLNEYLVRSISRKVREFKGTIIATFIISKSGLILGAEILSPENHTKKNEILEILNEMPAWQPGEYNGEQVSVREYVTIHIP